jgi:SAM-dependent methyltransferase
MRGIEHVPWIYDPLMAVAQATGLDTVVSGLVFCSVDDPARGLGEVRRVLRPGGRLRMLEHVRARGAFAASVQDLLQPAWTWFTGGCRPNRDTEAAVEAGGFVIEPEGRLARSDMRRFAARPRSQAGPSP